MKWQLRFLKNAVFGSLPNSIQESARKLKRRISPYSIEIDTFTLQQGFKQIELLKSSGCELQGKDLLEIGTGWSPLIPLLYFLSGCKKLILVDSQRLMDAQTFSETCNKLAAFKNEISKHLNINADEIEKKLNELATLNFESALQKINCEYLAPYNLLDNTIPNNSVDIVVSRAVFEHVPPDILREIFNVSRRILRDDGYMSHVIDNSDHWAHGDKTISILNFLKYSQKTFDYFSSKNPLDYQNRLRHCQYLKMIVDAGFSIVQEENIPDPRALSELQTLKIDSYFKQFSNEDLAVLNSYIVAR